MTPETVNAVGDKVQEYMAMLLNFSKGLVAQYGDTAWQTILALKRIDAAQDLVFGAASLAPIALIWYGVSKVYAYDKKQNEGKESFRQDWFGTGMSSVVGALLTAFFGMGFVFTWLDVWTWIALFKPELAIAHDMWLKVVGK
jgi:hypothetical protein